MNPVKSSGASRPIDLQEALHCRDWAHRSLRQQQAMTVGGAADVAHAQEGDQACMPWRELAGFPNGILHA